MPSLEGERIAREPKVGFLERYGPTLALLVAGTLALLVVLARGGVDPSQVGRAYVLAVGAIAAFHLVQELRRTGPWSPARNSAATSTLSSSVPADLAALRDALRASGSSRSQFERSILPLLREIAEDRLLLRGISPHRDPERAAAALGEGLSQALDAKAGDQALPTSRGLRPNELGALLDDLEAVGR